MEVVFRPEAEEELLEAQAWYEERSPGLGLEFARAVDAAITTVLRHPFAHPHLDEEFRHVILRRFPYSIIYLTGTNRVMVASCFHHSREPGSWQNRTADQEDK